MSPTLGADDLGGGLKRLPHTADPRCVKTTPLKSHRRSSGPLALHQNRNFAIPVLLDQDWLSEGHEEGQSQPFLSLLDAGSAGGAASMRYIGNGASKEKLEFPVLRTKGFERAINAY